MRERPPLVEVICGLAICAICFSLGFMFQRKPAEVIFRHMEEKVSCSYIGPDNFAVVETDGSGNLAFLSGTDELSLKPFRAFMADDYRTLRALLASINETKDWRCRMIGDAR